MEKNSRPLEITVPEEKSKLRLDKFISESIVTLSRSQVSKLISDGRILINTLPGKPSLLVRAGDKIEINLPEESPLDLSKKISLDIVYEDKDILVINKPAMISVHPGAGKKVYTVVDALKEYTKDLSSGFAPDRPGIVHRLDNETSGLLLIAKNDGAQSNLQQQFKEHQVGRTYFAFCYGRPKTQEGKIESYLIRNPSNRKKRMSLRHPNTKQIIRPQDHMLNSTIDISTGKKAISHFRVNTFFSEALSLLELNLETGRTHQIRIHLSEMGHPIVGDKIYTQHPPLKTIREMSLRFYLEAFPRSALLAKKIKFKHPTSGMNLEFEVDWPADLAELFKRVKSD
ncbi:MAG: RluA family pseudouridine synthase [Pseudomonadota bacterium]|nr:RluA family pseudouridine synthase [Pseudomonadota bacterium]